MAILHLWAFNVDIAHSPVAVMGAMLQFKFPDSTTCNGDG